MANKSPIDHALRALQLLFAIIVMGTDGYAIPQFHSVPVVIATRTGHFTGYTTVPDAWSFLIFCAGWTLLVVLLHYVASTRLPDHPWMQYARIAVEGVALLSWLAGFVSVAVDIGTDACPTGKKYCGSLVAATVFGALEWLLFVITTARTIMLVVKDIRRTKTSTFDLATGHGGRHDVDTRSPSEVTSGKSDGDMASDKKSDMSTRA